MKSIGGLVLLAVGLVGAQQSIERCSACHELGTRVDERVEATEARAHEEIRIGGRLGSDGETVPNKIITYGNSYCHLGEKRFLDIFDDVCETGPSKSWCNEIVHSFDEPIRSWFQERRNEPFALAICDQLIKGCSADAVAKAKQAAEESQSKRREKTVEIQDESKPVEEDGRSTASSQGQDFDYRKMAKDAVSVVLAKMQKIRTQFRTFYGTIFTHVKAGRWAELGALFKDANFLRENIVVLGMIVAMIVLVFGDLFLASKQPVRSNPTTRRGNAASPTKRTASSK